MSRRHHARPFRCQRTAFIALVLAASVTGCKDIEGRNNNRQGNAYYRDSKFIDAAVEYERALKKVDDPVIHYNLGLAYSKMFRGDDVVLIGLKDDPVCQIIPQTIPANRRVCVKAGDRTFNKCDEKREAAELAKLGELVTPMWKLGSGEKRTDTVCKAIGDYKSAAAGIAAMKVPGNVDEVEEWTDIQKGIVEQVNEVERACKGVDDARKAIEEQKKMAEEMKKLEEAKKAEDEKKKAAEEAKKAAAPKGKAGAKADKKDAKAGDKKDDKGSAAGGPAAAGSGAGSAAPAEAKKPEEPKPEEKKKEDPKPDLTTFDKAFAELRTSYEDLVGGKLVCSVEAKCLKVDLCAIKAESIAAEATKHLEQWVKVQRPDAEIEKDLAVLRKELQKEESKQTPTEIRDQLALARGQLPEAKPDQKAELQKEIARLTALPTRDEAKTTQLRKDIDELTRKFDTRNQMTQLWLDSGNYKGALTYWEGMLKSEPKNTDFMEMLAGISAKAGEWRIAVDWYNKVAAEAKTDEKKVSALSSIGNIAWSKLNSKLLSPDDALEMADKGIGALQKAFELDKNVKLLRQTGALLNFRSLTHGASFAGAIDRSTAQDLFRTARVMDEEAKKAQGTPAPGGTSPAPAPAPAGSGSAAKPPAEKPPAPSSSSKGSATPKAGG